MLIPLTSTQANLVYEVWPYPNAGFSGAMHFAMWIHFVNLMHKNGIDIVTFATDSCSTGLAAAKKLCTPNADLIALGVGYCGLDVMHYRYFDPYVRPLDNEVPPFAKRPDVEVYDEDDEEIHDACDDDMAQQSQDEDDGCEIPKLPARLL